jgi:F0F1-type ATP synthase membrane subunit b/b'
MTITFAILFVAALAFAIFLFFKNKQLKDEVLRVQNWAQTSIADAQKSADQKIAEMQQESQSSVAEAQKLIDQQFAEMQQEADRIKQHYESESRKIQEAADALVAKTIRELEPLRKYEKLRDAEADAQRQLAEALKEATSLRAEAQNLLEQSRSAAANERTLAINRAKEIRGQADALLNQATQDAGRIMSEAEKRAEQIGGDAYEALRDKHTLENAVQALWNVTEGYGDRYVVPSHSLLDDLAANFGYTEAGQAFQSARAQSRRMVEQKQASACNYEEADRRDRANRFVVDAFNGKVDAILSRFRNDNYGTLEQKIRDAFSLVNLNGLAFHDARILPTYLDARLAELKWAVVVHELAKKQREEQRYLKEKLRDEQKAEEERQRMIREAAKEKEQAAKETELKRTALEEAERTLALAHTKDRTRLEQEVQKLRQDVADANQRIEDATKRELTIAQQTKVGHVYIISNIGSFGEGIYKIGQTRREPQVRVDELGDASVPFEFDIHALIETENAPALEHRIHKQFLGAQVNKMNSRKEFFRVPLAELHKEIEKLKQGEDFTIKVWTDKAVATQYKESLDIESDPQKKEKWLARQKALADRQLRLDALRLPVSDVGETNGDNEAV